MGRVGLGGASTNAEDARVGWGWAAVVAVAATPMVAVRAVARGQWGKEEIAISPDGEGTPSSFPPTQATRGKARPSVSGRRACL